jgi:transposase
MSATQHTNTPVDELDAWKARARELESLLKHWELRYAKLEYKHNDLLRRIFGPKNEALSPDQRALFGIGVAPLQSPPPSNATPQASATSATKPKRKGGGRRPKPENLPVHREVIELPEAMRTGLKVIREEITEQIEYRPSLFYRHQIVRLVYGDPERLRPPMLAPLPPQIIPQAGVGPGFITHVVIAKYLDHLPLYRQERIDARAGVWIGRQARCRYVEAAAHLLITIREQLKQKILASRYVQVDETFTKLLDPERRGRSRDAYLWGYHAPHEKALVLEFSPSRSGSILHDFFPRHWSGVVQTDGAKMYPGVFKHRPGVIHIECVGHLRRYVVEALRANEQEALPLLKDITELYRIEQEAQTLALSHEQRGYYRHAKAKPILKRLQRRLRKLEHSGPLFGNLREAVTYANRRWRHLVRYAKVGFGHVNIDQNSIERCFRAGKVGLRNYLFIGHPRAGWRSAVIYSVIGTCRLVGVNPEAYIRWVLPKLAAASNQTATGLLPHDFARLGLDEPCVTHSPPAFEPTPSS